MAKVYLEQRAFFVCPDCRVESEAMPGTEDGAVVVCAKCGKSHRVAGSGYSILDWNSRNLENANRVAGIKQVNKSGGYPRSELL